jgi:DNA-binding NarL/FixJ family response regulator
MPRIRVLLVDDHALFRHGVAELLRSADGFEVVGEAGDGQQALDLVRERKPDVVLMDVAMPVMDGLEATRRITVEIPTVRVVIVSVLDRGEQSRAEAAECGASAFLPKLVTPDVLYEALRAAAGAVSPARA